MIAASHKPSIFIASSVERLEIAYTLQEHLEYAAEPTVWTQDIFKPTSYALADLVNASRRFQFAIFVFTADDIVTARDRMVKSVRANVIFEFGLFIGALGVFRCFLVTPKQSEPLQFPTDLLGLAPPTYVADRADQNLVAALGPAANRVRRAIREQLRSEEPPSTAQARGDERKRSRQIRAQDFIKIWNDPELTLARQTVRELPSSPYGYDEEELVAHQALRRLFTFLENVADAVLDGEVEEAAAKAVFNRPIEQLWPHLYTLMAPANHAEDWWRARPPRLAELYARWSPREPA